MTPAEGAALNHGDWVAVKVQGSKNRYILAWVYRPSDRGPGFLKLGQVLPKSGKSRYFEVHINHLTSVPDPARPR